QSATNLPVASHRRMCRATEPAIHLPSGLNARALIGSLESSVVSACRVAAFQTRTAPPPPLVKSFVPSRWIDTVVFASGVGPTSAYGLPVAGFQRWTMRSPLDARYMPSLEKASVRTSPEALSLCSVFFWSKSQT